jgi:hypothetical protein
MDKIKRVDWSPDAESIKDQRAAIKAGGTGKDVNSKTVHAVGDKKIVCPQCQTAGHVTTRRVKAKKGISGGKATGGTYRWLLDPGDRSVAQGDGHSGGVHELQESVDVLTRDAKGTRTPDSLLAKYARTVGYCRRPRVVATACHPGSVRVGSRCGQVWWSAPAVATTGRRTDT